MSLEVAEAREGRRFALVVVVGVATLVATALGVFLIAKGRAAAAARESETRTREVANGPRVRVVRAITAPPLRSIELQAEARPFASVTLYAKVSGYLRKISVDKGDRVRANQLVAVIESPEIDRQYDAARADARYKKANADRAATLSKPGVVSAAEAEVQRGQAQVAEAQLAALAQQKSYEILRAPFAGVVTARFADPGALVQAAVGAQTGALPVVTISTPERLRVYAYVDQRNAARVQVGDRAAVTVAERPGVKIDGHVARRTDELDARTRMMLVEVDVDNHEGKIVPGSFVNVTLTVASPPLVEIPVEALMAQGERSSVFVLKEGALAQRPVVVAENDGRTVRLASGLGDGEWVGLSVGGELTDGARVQPVFPESHAAPR